MVKLTNPMALMSILTKLYFRSILIYLSIDIVYLFIKKQFKCKNKVIIEYLQ